MSGAGSGFAGSIGGKFFGQSPLWIDVAKPPGFSKQVAVTWSAWAKNFALGAHIVKSPNLIWLAITVLVYGVFPYDIEAAKVLRSDWILRRFVINYGVCLAYYGYWEVALFAAQWSNRKFRADTWISVPRFAHNLWYWSIGVAVYTLLEVCFLRGWATGALPYMSDSDILASPGNAVRFVLWTLVVPLWRGIHFYFAHRFIHIRFMYKYVHSLHHRNIDIEPFAGLCMHPIEHLYYFSCVFPSLYFYMHPLHLLYNGMHLLLSPGASHSGWEDHVQSDQFHYVHHAKFWCNYGSASVPLDAFFGTFADRLGKHETLEDKNSTVAPALKSPSFVTKIPTHFYTYMSFTGLVFAALGATFFDAGETGSWFRSNPYSLAAFVGFGPVIFAFILLVTTGDKLDIRWPFAHEDMLGKFGLHFAIGFVTGVLPIYHTLVIGLTDTSPYCSLWGC